MVTAGMVTLMPVFIAPVCQVGDPLEFTCNTTGNFMRWIFTVGDDQGVPLEHRRNINSQDESQANVRNTCEFNNFHLHENFSSGNTPPDFYISN